MPRSKLRTTPLPVLLLRAISEYNKEYNLSVAIEPVAKALAAGRPFSYARLDPRSKRVRGGRYGVVTPEIQAYAGALVLCGWVAWVHHAKGIWHFNETSVGGEVFLSHEFLPSVIKAIAIGRSKALLEKIKDGRYHPEFRVEDAVRMLERSVGIGDARTD